MNNIPYDQYIREVTNNLSRGGVFLTTGDDKKANTMVIGWGGITVFWGKPIFLVPVRKSRFSYNFINENNEFTVSIPLDTDLKKSLAFCGTKSGRDYDKFEECNLTKIPGQRVNVPIIGECPLHYECKVVFKQDMDPEKLDPAINERFYPDYHTMFYGEILACYTTR